MNLRSRFLVVALLGAGAIPAAERPFSVHVISYPSAFPLGAASAYVDTRGVVEGWLKTEMRVDIAYQGHMPLPFVPGPWRGYAQGGLFSVYAEVEDQTREKARTVPTGRIPVSGYRGEAESLSGLVRATEGACVPSRRRQLSGERGGRGDRELVQEA